MFAFFAEFVFRPNCAITKWLDFSNHTVTQANLCMQIHHKWSFVICSTCLTTIFPVVDSCLNSNFFDVLEDFITNLQFLCKSLLVNLVKLNEFIHRFRNSAVLKEFKLTREAFEDCLSRSFICPHEVAILTELMQTEEEDYFCQQIQVCSKPSSQQTFFLFKFH